MAALSALTVQEGIGLDGYSDTSFGALWGAYGETTCDSWNSILARDSANIVTETTECEVISGTLSDPYTALRVDFDLNDPTSPVAGVDHVVGLRDAWEKGAQDMTPDQREKFANDPLNLIAAYNIPIQEKNGADISTWEPVNEDFICHYASMQVAIKFKYGLWVSSAEHQRLGELLDEGCDDMFLMTRGGAVWSQDTEGRAPLLELPKDSITPTTEATNTKQDESSQIEPKYAFYENCMSAQAFGAAPLYLGQPGYRPALDRDGDGVACE